MSMFILQLCTKRACNGHVIIFGSVQGHVEKRLCLKFLFPIQISFPKMGRGSGVVHWHRKTVEDSLDTYDQIFE